VSRRRYIMSESTETVVNGAASPVPGGAKKAGAKKTGPAKRKAKASGRTERGGKKKRASGGTVATKDRNGKKIRRAKAGGKGRLAAQKIYVMVVRVPEKLHARMWAKARKAGTSLNALAISAIERAVK
jgi:hypothetical protein